MSSLLKDVEDPATNADKALRRWRNAVSVVKNPRRRFRMVADLARRSEAEKKRIEIPETESLLIGPKLPTENYAEALSDGRSVVSLYRYLARDYAEWLSRSTSIVPLLRYGRRGFRKVSELLKRLSKAKENETEIQLTELAERRVVGETAVNCNSLIAPAQDYSRSPSDLSINGRNLGGGEASTPSATAAAGTTNNSATSPNTAIDIPPSAPPVNDQLSASLAVTEDANWLRQKQNALMVAAIFTATITSQAVLNPPGGNWQDTITNQHIAGTSIMAHNFPREYRAFTASNTAAFVASLGVILILAVGLPFKHESCLWLLKAVMAAAIISMAFALWIAISNHDHHQDT